MTRDDCNISYVATSKEDSCQISYLVSKLQRISGPGEYRGMKTSLASYIVASTKNSGNDLPACTLHLEFSHEK